MSGKRLLIPVVFLFATATAEAQDSVVLKKLVTDYFEGVAAKDFVQLDALVTRDFHIYEDGKVWTNDSAFYNIQRHQPFTVRFSLTDFDIFADTRSADARYHERADFLVMDSIRFTLNFLSSASFRKTAAGWKIHLIHVTSEKTPEVGMPGYYRKHDTVRYIPEHYRERVAAFEREDADAGGNASGGRGAGLGKVVLLGNSITEFGDWKKLLKDPAVVNRGIAGDNTFGMLDRLPEVIAQRPGKLYVEAGINDIGQDVPVGMIVGNIFSIVQYVRVKSPGTKVYVVSVLPTNEQAQRAYPEVAGKNDVVQEVDGRLREGAGQNGYVYIDLAGKVSDGTGKLDARYSKSDGLHLNEAGYGVLITLLADR